MRTRANGSAPIRSLHNIATANGVAATETIPGAKVAEALRPMGPARVRPARELRPTERDFLVDVAMLGLAVLTAMLSAAAAGVPTEGMPWLAAFPALTVALLAGRGIYRSRKVVHFLEDARSVIAATAVAAMTIAFARVLLGADPDAASQAVREWIFAASFLIVGRGAVNLSALHMRTRGRGGRPTLIVGAGRVGHLLARRLMDRPQIGLRPVGFLDDDPLETDDDSGCPVLGPSWQLEPLVEANGIEHAILSFSRATHADELEVSRRLQQLGVSVSVVPRLFEDIPDRMSVERVGGVPVLSIYPSKPRGWQFKVKYAADRVLAAAAILVAAPVMAAAALGTLVTTGRPILFRQRRVGLDGSQFEMLKFRTMRNARQEKPSMAAIEEALRNGLGPGGIEGEDRRTRFGSFLRRTSVDELPQLFNVLRGDMSIVGPRPERDHIAAKLRESVYRYEDRDRVKSGITGWAQVHGLRGRTSLSDRVEWDNYYIENWSLWLDVKVLLLTVVAVFRDSFD